MVGTGVIVDERGFVVTNRHVVGTARSVNVRLADGTELDGRGRCWPRPPTTWPSSSVDAGQKLPALPLAPVSDLMVGETVIAIGHPFGYTNTVSTGIISALGREITMPTGDVLTGLIQTDASINPGNSGGPLLNINGELIGINVALRDGAQGIAFAINAGTVKQVLRPAPQRPAGGRRRRTACCMQEKVLRRDRRPAARRGGQWRPGELRSGRRDSRRRHADGQQQLRCRAGLVGHQAGQTVALKVVRGGQEMTVELVLQSGNGAGAVAQANSGDQPRIPGAPLGVPIAIRP